MRMDEVDRAWQEAFLIEFEALPGKYAERLKKIIKLS